MLNINGQGLLSVNHYKYLNVCPEPIDEPGKGKEEVAQEQAEVEITPESRDTKSSMEVMGSVVRHALTVFVLEGHR